MKRTKRYKIQRETIQQTGQRLDATHVHNVRTLQNIKIPCADQRDAAPTIIRGRLDEKMDGSIFTPR